MTTFGHYAPQGLDIEKGVTESVDFADRIVRQGFIKKVFGLLAAQLTLTTIIGAFMVFSPAVKLFIATNSWILGLAVLASFGLIITFGVSESARRNHPTNLVLLFLFTAAEGVLVGAASAQSSTEVVVLAFGITAGVTTALCLYATMTKKDYTANGAILFSVLLALCLTGLIGVFIHAPAFHIAISCVGAVLFSCYIVYDIQLLLGGQHKHKISPDEYVSATISIYLDIINLFLHILRILNELNRR